MYSFLTLLCFLLIRHTEGKDEPSASSDFVAVKSAIRLRLDEAIFQQLSRITGHLYNRQITQAAIPPQQQCFPEGCMQIYNFQITAHRPPTVVMVTPTPPNLIAIAIRDFDFYTTGSLSGQLQPLQPLPIAVPASGSLSSSATQLGIAAILDAQKTSQNIPYLRLVSCSLNEGNVAARVENMGLINEIVNTKYQAEITAKTREVIQTTMCTNVQEIIENEFNRRLAKLPTTMSAKELFDVFIKKFDVGDVERKRYSRQTDWIRNGREVASFFPEASIVRPTLNHARANQVPTQQATSDVPKASQFFNLKRLANLVIHTDIMDTSSTYEKFFIGVNGEVSVPDETYTTTNPYSRPNTLKFVNPANGRALELLVSEYTINSLLMKAHNIDAVVFRIGSDSSSFGKLLRTSCPMDEVCLSDIVPEPGEKYPATQLEIVVRSTQPPVVQLSRGIATVRFEGRALFYIEGTSKKVGVIPFESTAVLKVSTADGKIAGTFSIPTLIFKKDLDFFGLTAESLDGLRNATRGALQNLVNARLKDGIALSTRPNTMFSNPTVLVTNGAVLIQTDVNVEQEFYSPPASEDRRARHYIYV